MRVESQASLCSGLSAFVPIGWAEIKDTAMVLSSKGMGKGGPCLQVGTLTSAIIRAPGSSSVAGRNGTRYRNCGIY